MTDQLEQHRLETAVRLLDRDDVATFLLVKGIKGRRREPCDCPVANFLAQEVGRPVTVSSGEHGNAYCGDACVSLPEVVKSFIRIFDDYLGNAFIELDSDLENVNG